MKEFISQHGETIVEAAGTVLIIGFLAVMTLGGGLSAGIRLFSNWLYG